MSISTPLGRFGRLSRILALVTLSSGAALAAAPPPSGALPTTPGLTYKMYDAFAFQTLGSTLEWSYSGGGRYMNAGGELDVNLDLPSGAQVEEVTWYYVDNDDQQAAFLFYYIAPNQVNGTQISLATSEGVNSDAIQSITMPNPVTTIDNSQFVYRLEWSQVPGVHFRLYAVRVGYKLQVSPAPATATFNDVPTSDFGFQYIEALAASGITGGCGGGNYCPDNPVTRRQMAIFLSKALGLQWP